MQKAKCQLYRQIEAAADDSSCRERASAGSRTRNPRITNAVLYQLKLRWHSFRRTNKHRLGGHLPVIELAYGGLREGSRAGQDEPKCEGFTAIAPYLL